MLFSLCSSSGTNSRQSVAVTSRRKGGGLVRPAKGGIKFIVMVTGHKSVSRGRVFWPSFR